MLTTKYPATLRLWNDCWENTDKLKAGEHFQQNFEIGASQARLHRPIDEGCLLFFSVNLLESIFLFQNQWFQSRTNYFNINPKIKQKNTETTFHFHFFLLDSKSVTLIFRLYIFFLGFLHEYIGSYVKA